ncbi:MAG: hypothetical protein ACP5ON_10060 [Bacteroidota bacterium]
MKSLFNPILITGVFVFLSVSRKAEANISDSTTSLISFRSTYDSVLDTIIVARVGNVKLTAKEYVLNYIFGPAFIFKAKNPRHALLDAMVDEALLSLAANDSIHGLTERTEKIVDAIEDDISTEQLYRKKIWDTLRVTEDEIDEALKQSLKTINFRWIYSSDLSGIDSLSPNSSHWL